MIHDFRVDSHWEPFLAGDGRTYEYPMKRSGFQVSYSKPGVYRWLLEPPSPKYRTEVYIGETENLAERRNKKLSRHLAQRKKEGYRISYQFLHVGSIQVNQSRAETNFHNPFIRKAVENLLLAEIDPTEFIVLNSRLTPIERRKKRAEREYAKLPHREKWR